MSTLSEIAVFRKQCIPQPGWLTSVRCPLCRHPAALHASVHTIKPYWCWEGERCLWKSKGIIPSGQETVFNTWFGQLGALRKKAKRGAISILYSTPPPKEINSKTRLEIWIVFKSFLPFLLPHPLISPTLLPSSLSLPLSVPVSIKSPFPFLLCLNCHISPFSILPSLRIWCCLAASDPAFLYAVFPARPPPPLKDWLKFHRKRWLHFSAPGHCSLQAPFLRAVRSQLWVGYLLSANSFPGVRHSVYRRVFLSFCFLFFFLYSSSKCRSD